MAFFKQSWNTFSLLLLMETYSNWFISQMFSIWWKGPYPSGRWYLQQRQPLHQSQHLHWQGCQSQGTHLLWRYTCHWGQFTDFENTFETINEPDYLIELGNGTAVGVLESKEWFEWDNDLMPLQASTSLTFHVQVQSHSHQGYRYIYPWNNYVSKHSLATLRGNLLCCHAANQWLFNN